MTPQEYLEWLISEIDLADSRFEPEAGSALIRAKVKFLTISFPSQLIEEQTENSFSDGLD